VFIRLLQALRSSAAMSVPLQRVVSVHYVLLHLAGRLRVPEAVLGHALWPDYRDAVYRGRDAEAWAAFLRSCSAQNVFAIAIARAATLADARLEFARRFLCVHYFLLCLTRVLDDGSIDNLEDDYEDWDAWTTSLVRAVGGSDVEAWATRLAGLSDTQLVQYAAEVASADGLFTY
jgi:hypothetical protein